MQTRDLAFSVLALVGSISAHAASITFPSNSTITGSILLEPGWSSPQGNYATYSNPLNLALGKSVTVSGTLGVYSSINHAPIHQAEFLTDGKYGNGRSWIANSANPWLKIDLGSVQTFDTLRFGRDRLPGGYSDRDPGQFTISVSSENSLYTQIFSSVVYGFSGTLTNQQTVQAQFDSQSARYVMLSLTNGIDNSYPSWVGIDEVEIMNSNGSSSVPEIDAASGSGALALLTGAIALMTEQRNTRRNPRRAV